MPTVLPIRRHAQDDKFECGRAVAQMVIAFETGAAPKPQSDVRTMVTAWEQQNPGDPEIHWETPPNALASCINTAIGRQLYARRSVTLSALVAEVATGIGLGHGSAIVMAGEQHWLLANGVIDSSTLKCIDPLPSIEALTSATGFVTKCKNGAQDPVCPVVAGSSVPPHVATDWCDVIEGDDANSASWWNTLLEFNQVVDCSTANPLAITPQHSVLPKVQRAWHIVAIHVWLWLRWMWMIDLWRKMRALVLRRPKPPIPDTADGWFVWALESATELGLVPADAPTRNGGSWRIRGLGTTESFQVVAILDRVQNRGWLMYFLARSGKFVIARKAAPPILESLQSQTGELWWTSSRHSPSPVYPFVERGGRFERIVDGVTFERQQLSLGRQ